MMTIKKYIIPISMVLTSVIVLAIFAIKMFVISDTHNTNPDLITTIGYTTSGEAEQKISSGIATIYLPGKYGVDLWKNNAKIIRHHTYTVIYKVRNLYTAGNLWLGHGPMDGQPFYDKLTKDWQVFTNVFFVDTKDPESTTYSFTTSVAQTNQFGYIKIYQDL
jgi:hypothetical protein